MEILIGICGLIFVLWFWTVGPGRGHTIKTTRRQTRGQEWLFGVKHEMVPKRKK